MRLFVALLGCALALNGAGKLSGRRAPGFSLPDMQMRQHDLADYRGKVVLIDIMRTNCPECQKLTPKLEAVKAKYSGRVVVLSVVTLPDNQTTVAKYVAAHKVTGPVLFDCGQMAASFVKATPQNPSMSLPHLFFVDTGGVIRNDFSDHEVSGLTVEALSAEVERLLVPASKSK